MKKFTDMIAAALESIEERFPWDLAEQIEQDNTPLMIDVREPGEFDSMHIEGSINVPRGVLETACEYDYDETEPSLAAARDREVAIICRSGNRSALAAVTLSMMGFEKVWSLKTGLRGWNDFEQPMVDSEGREVDIDDADEFFTTRLRDDQKSPG